MALLKPDITFLQQLADAAEARVLAGYLQPHHIAISSKPKAGFRFDPVTNIDKETELCLRQMIRDHFPDHAILGEEFGASGQGDYQWVIDPIDGTRPFLCGLPVWGCLIGLLEQGNASMGMMTQPYTGDRFWSDGTRSWFSGRFGTQVMHSRQKVALHQAILHTTSPESVALYPDNNFAALHEKTLMTRYGGECYAMAMLAAGHIDICVEYSLQPYDIVAFIPIIENAGGVVTTLQGQRAEGGGAIVASANPVLHQQVLDILNR